ncbi:MAG TPA: DUF3016 domain-containing protein [Aquabacterium sp.]|nr:DUF3016 domain-containing protein [Aquabacterium sp.]
MRQPLLALLSAALSATVLTSPARAGRAEVTYDHPERYTDAGRGRDAESARRTLASHLADLAQQHLPAGQQLAIVVTDIDLAGQVPPTVAARHGEVRVLGRNVDWPRIALRYTLRDGERVLAEGSEEVADMAYMQHGGLPAGNGALPYERRMLSDWFERRFTAATAAGK